MSDDYESTRFIFKGRALMCRRGAAARSRLIVDGVVQDKDTRPGFPVGQCVKHRVYGLGKVARHHGTFENFQSFQVEVDFEKHGRKTFVVHLLRDNMHPEDGPSS